MRAPCEASTLHGLAMAVRAVGEMAATRQQRAA